MVVVMDEVTRFGSSTTAAVSALSVTVVVRTNDDMRDEEETPDPILKPVTLL